jgi:hypothetical protein
LGGLGPAQSGVSNLPGYSVSTGWGETQ